MTIFLPPPVSVATLSGLSLTSLLEDMFVDPVTGKPLVDRKTITALLKGKAAPRTKEKLDHFIDKNCPGQRKRMLDGRTKHSDELRGRGMMGAADVLDQGLTWHMMIEEMDWSARKQRRSKSAPLIFLKKLLPLEETSAMATAAWDEGRLSDIIPILEQSSFSPFIRIAHLKKTLRGCNDPETFRRLLGPVRAVGALYLLVAFERAFFWDPKKTHVFVFGPLLPTQDEKGSMQGPMVRLLLKGLEELELKEGVDAKKTKRAARLNLLQFADGDDEYKLKKIRRWIKKGIFPTRGEFRTLTRGVAQKKERWIIDLSICSITRCAT